MTEIVVVLDFVLDDGVVLVVVWTGTKLEGKGSFGIYYRFGSKALVVPDKLVLLVDVVMKTMKVVV